MTTQTTTRTQSRVDIGQETAKFTLSACAVISVLIGLWATACLISGFVSSGAGTMLRGYLSTLTGM